MSSPYWTAPALWPSETVFVVCGGPSVETQNLELLRGRRVVVINSSCYAVPWADLLFFGDSRWFRENRTAVANFGGMVVTVAPQGDTPNLKRMRKFPPPGLSDQRDTLKMRRTSLHATAQAFRGDKNHPARLRWPSRQGRAQSSSQAAPVAAARRLLGRTTT